ncbi:MAG: RidA family protein [Methanobacteriota archaeon]|nr:MAG: RidA family protein [Euryarchaeota archaeon]
MPKEIISTEKAPAAIGPYSQAVKVGNLLFTSGQGGFDPETRKLVEGSIEEETKRTLENIKAIVEAAGGKMENAVKMTVFMKDINNYSRINKVYEEFFGEAKPARSAVEVSNLPAGLNVEIEGIFLLE